MKHFFEYILWLKGLPIDKAKHILESINKEDNILSWQEKRKWEIFKYHCDNTPFYNSFINGNTSEWKDINIVTKDFLKENFSKNSGLKSNKQFYRETSGSTGQPLLYAIDYLNHALTWTLIEDRYNSANINISERQARFYGSPVMFYKKVKEQIKDFVSKRYRFPILDLSDESLDKWVRMFSRTKYAYVYGYSYPIISFAKYLKRLNIRLKDICPTLKSCIVTSEMCSFEEQQIIEEAFGFPVFNEYGCSEMGVIAFGKSGKWLVSDELIHVEIVDDDDNPLPNGELGRVICTSLYNRSTPFIRYDLGDLASIEIIDGRKYITNLIGRQEDVALLPSGKKAPGDSVFYYVFSQFNNFF